MGNARTEKLGGPPPGERRMMKSPEKKARELLLRTQIFNLKIRAFTDVQIAEQLQVNVRTVQRLRARSMAEYFASAEEFAQQKVAETHAQIDASIRAWMPRALGYIDKDEKVVPPDPEAGRLIDRLLRTKSTLLNHGRPQRVEHTGAAGGPIMTANIDARTAAARVRESFANAPQVILKAGESPEDAPKIVKH